MPKVNERKRLVALKSLPLFVRLGYDKVSFQDISEAADVPRTAIYRYYKTKRQIFDAAILEVILEVRAAIAEVRAKEGTAAARLQGVCDVVCELLYRERDFVQVIFDFVFHKIAAGEDMAQRVMEFTGGLKATFAELTDEGLADGSLRKGIQSEMMSELFFATMESAAMKMLLGVEKSPKNAKKRFSSAIAAITS